MYLGDISKYMQTGPMIGPSEMEKHGEAIIPIRTGGVMPILGVKGEARLKTIRRHPG